MDGCSVRRVEYVPRWILAYRALTLFTEGILACESSGHAVSSCTQIGGFPFILDSRCGAWEMTDCGYLLVAPYGAIRSLNARHGGMSVGSDLLTQVGAQNLEHQDGLAIDVCVTHHGPTPTVAEASQPASIVATRRKSSRHTCRFEGSDHTYARDRHAAEIANVEKLRFSLGCIIPKC